MAFTQSQSLGLFILSTSIIVGLLLYTIKLQEKELLSIAKLSLELQAQHESIDKGKADRIKKLLWQKVIDGTPKLHRNTLNNLRFSLRKRIVSEGGDVGEAVKLKVKDLIFDEIHGRQKTQLKEIVKNVMASHL